MSLIYAPPLHEAELSEFTRLLRVTGAGKQSRESGILSISIASDQFSSSVHDRNDQSGVTHETSAGEEAAASSTERLRASLIRGIDPLELVYRVESCCCFHSRSLGLSTILFFGRAISVKGDGG